MQINALLRQVHHCVTLVNDETDHKIETRLNRLTCKDPIQVGEKVLIHRPQSTIAQVSHLPWIGEFTIVKTNDMMSQVENENGDNTWIHRACIRRLAPRPTHLSDITPPLAPCDTLQNTHDHSSPRTSGGHNSTQTSTPSKYSTTNTKRKKTNANKANTTANSRMCPNFVMN